MTLSIDRDTFLYWLHQNLTSVGQDCLDLADVCLALLVDHGYLVVLLLLLPNHPHLPPDHEDYHGKIENHETRNENDGTGALRA